mmetsp:Transcript_25104/g.65154  ORF Transcript_25104/g.65154 Transcript_25104/m.65154 type:complete len:327 (+) Transcript_25104:353-1333(+)
MPGLLRTWSGTADRASAAVHALLLRSPYEYSTLDTLVISGAVRLLATVCDLPLMAGKTRQELREQLCVSWAMWAGGTLLLVTRSATRRIQEQSRQAVARRAALVDGQLMVTADMEFSSAEYQAAFERWPGHGSLDASSPVLTLLAHVTISGQLVIRQDVCTRARMLRMIPFSLAHVVRLVIWRRLSPAQRSWLSMAIVSAIWIHLLEMIRSGDKCTGSLWTNMASSSLPGRLLTQMVVTVMVGVMFPVTVRHAPWQACQMCAAPMAFFHLASPLRVEDPQLRSAAAYQQLAALSMWALVLWNLALAVRAVFAEQTMLRFLSSLRSD